MSANCDFTSFPLCIFGVAQRHLSGCLIYQDLTSQMKLFNPKFLSPFTVIHAFMFSSISLVVPLHSSIRKSPSTPNFPCYKPHYPLNHKYNKSKNLYYLFFFRDLLAYGSSLQYNIYNSSNLYGPYNLTKASLLVGRHFSNNIHRFTPGVKEIAIIEQRSSSS